MASKNVGLLQKYNVKRIDGVEKPNSKYFVLDYVNDPLAKYALHEYAILAKSKGWLALYDDLMYELRCQGFKPQI